MFSKSNSSERQLVLCDKDINGGDPTFLDIGNHHPVALFGGCYHSAVICDSIKNSPERRIESVYLPGGEKASSVACCFDSAVGFSRHILLVSKEGHVFGYGSNNYGQLGLGKDKEKSASFIKICSLILYEIRAAYA